MIKELKECENHRESAVFYYSNYRQVIDYFNTIAPEDAGELAISILELGFTGKLSTNNPYIRSALRSFETQADRNKKNYEGKITLKREYEIEDKNYRLIADMTLQGATQQEIADKLNITRQTVSNRLLKIRSDFPELLCAPATEEPSIDVKDVKNVSDVKDVRFDTSNISNKMSKMLDVLENNVKHVRNVIDVNRESDNDNDNDNVNDNDSVSDNGNESESVSEATALLLTDKTSLTSQQPTTLPIPEHLPLTDWTTKTAELCSGLEDWEKALLRAALDRLPQSKKSSPCWVYCALKKLRPARGRVKDNVYRLNYGPFQSEVDEMVDCERVELENRIKRQNEIDQSISKEQPKSQMIIIPRVENERRKEVYNIEDF